MGTYVHRQPREFNYTAERVLRALEVIILRPTSAPGVAAAIGVHPRTARRILHSLEAQQYVERRAGRGRGVNYFWPTVRLLAMAGQLASQLPLVRRGEEVARQVEQQTGLTAYVAVPCYLDVLVIASTGARELRPWATLPARTDAAGRVLLAHRDAWRRSCAECEPALGDEEADAAAIRQRGFAVVRGEEERRGSVAVPVLTSEQPIAAFAVRGRIDLPTEPRLIALLQSAATQLGAL